MMMKSRWHVKEVIKVRGVYIYLCSGHYATSQGSSTGLRYRVAKTYRMPYVYRSFSAKEPYDERLFCEK